VAKIKKVEKTESAKPGKTLKDISLPRWVLPVAALIILAAIAYVRFSHLAYDPPVDIFWSQDLWTDPPQYTSYARNAVLFGDWNPLNEQMYLTFRINSMGPLAYVVFAMFGAGFWQSNLVAVLLSLAAIVLFGLAVARLRNPLAGILTAVLLGFNYIFLTYGRVPFLENAMNFWLALAVFCLALAVKRPFWYIGAGLACGLGTFFGKMIGLHAVPALLIFAAFIGWRDAQREPGKKWYIPAVYFLAGVAAVAVVWFPAIYMKIGDYFAEKSTALYGSPEGLQSISGFFNRIFSFGSDTRLLPVIAIFGFIGVGIAFLPLAANGKFAKRLEKIRPEYLLMSLWFWAAYLALMPWNYRPLRYETVLVIPLAGAAALVLTDLVRRRKESEQASVTATPIWSLILGTVFFALPLYHLITVRIAQPQMGHADGKAALLAVVIALAGSFLFFAAGKKIIRGWNRFRAGSRVSEAIIIVTVLATVLYQGSMIKGWWDHSQQAMAAASWDLDDVLGENAVLVGSYATGLTLENDSKNIVYMFGVANINYGLFNDYPITHLAIIDDRNDPVFSQYESVAGRARRVSSYVIGNRPVGVFRVAEHSPNAQAQAYQPSDYEQAMRCYDMRREDSMLIYLQRFVAEHPDNFSASRFYGNYYMRDSTFDSASYYFEKAVERYPDDYALHLKAAHCQMMSFEKDRNATRYQRAQQHYLDVLRLQPNDPALRSQLEPMIRR